MTLTLPPAPASIFHLSLGSLEWSLSPPLWKHAVIASCNRQHTVANCGWSCWTWQSEVQEALKPATAAKIVCTPEKWIRCVFSPSTCSVSAAQPLSPLLAIHCMTAQSSDSILIGMQRTPVFFFLSLFQTFWLLLKASLKFGSICPCLVEDRNPIGSAAAALLWNSGKGCVCSWGLCRPLHTAAQLIQAAARAEMLVGSGNIGQMNFGRWSHSLPAFPHTRYLPVLSLSRSLFPPSSLPPLFLFHSSSLSFSPRSLCITSLVLSGVSLMDLVVEPHVGHSHAVLGQRARLVRADGGGGAESLYGLQVLHQTVLLGHSLGSESQTHLGGQRGGEGEGKEEGEVKEGERGRWGRGGKTGMDDC